MAALVSVIVVNWNGLGYLKRCLTDLASQTYSEMEIILVDNGSTDGSVEWAQTYCPSIRLIVNDENRGFAAANNQGIRVARGKYVALLNNDTWPEPDWLGQLVAAIERDERVGGVASKMLLAHRPQVVNSLGICIDRCGISWDREGGRRDASDSETVVKVFGPCAGAALYRRAMLDEIGLFDEGFFAYLEDVDLAWRACWQGWESLYVPTARVYHVHSGTSKEGSPSKTYWLARNKIRLLLKNYPAPYLWFYLPAILFYEALSLAFATLNGRGTAALKGRWAGLTKLSELWRMRRRNLEGRRRSAHEVFEQLAAAQWPWQVKARYEHLR